MLPAHPIGRHGVGGRPRGLARQGQKSSGDVVGVGRLGQVVHRSGLHGGHRRGDVAVAGEHHNPRPGAHLGDGFDHLEAVAVLQAHVEDRERGGVRLHRRQGLGHAAHKIGFEAPRFQGPAKTDAQRRVVIQQQQAAVWQLGDGGGDVAHGLFLVGGRSGRTNRSILRRGIMSLDRFSLQAST